MNILLISTPLISGFTILSIGRYLGKKGSVFISIISILISQLISFNILIDYLRNNTISRYNLGKWFEIGVYNTNIEFIFDKHSIIMINLISIIALIVIIYSVWYMENDAHITRFLSKLLIFSVTMFILVTSNNFILLFAGWETVGVMSYLLINFWYNSLNSNKSAFKAILYNKIGDIGFILGITLLINLYSNSNIKNLLIIDNNLPQSFIDLLLFFFIIAAIAKSAQIFLHCWLGDAMAGPTPVSALLHAATMVTAGVFLLVRLSSNYFLEISPINQNLIIIIGALTILFGGLSSLGQYDIKKLIAFSTCSQIGYMFINNGFNNQYSSVYYTIFNSTGLADSSLFHLFTHGFFKALLFLSAGILIHNFNNDQDIRKYGSFIFKFPITYMFFVIGSLSIISFPFLSGFYSKENIINNSLLPFNNFYISVFLIFGALLTNLYSFKLLFSSFFAYNNSPKHLFFSNYSEIPYKYIPAFFVLLIGSIFIGYISLDFFIGPGITPFGLDHELYPGHNIIKLIPILIIFVVILINIYILNNSSYIYYIFNSFNRMFISFITFFNRRGFFDPIFNYLLAYPTLLMSYYTFKNVDRGYLEYLGPIGLFRSFFQFYDKYNLNNQNINNINYLFLYFFISIFVVISSLFLFMN